MDSIIANLLKLTPEAWRLTLSLALAVFSMFALRGLGHFLNLDKTWVIVGLSTAWMTVINVVSAVISGVSKWKRKRREKSTQEAFATRSFRGALPQHRWVLIQYKQHDHQEFSAPYDGDFYRMAQQGLLDNVTLNHNAQMHHFRIPDHLWSILDNPPAGWAEAASPPDFR